MNLEIELAANVAQVSNRLYRQFAIGRASENSKRLGIVVSPEPASLQYGRQEICARKPEILR